MSTRRTSTTGSSTAAGRGRPRSTRSRRACRPVCAPTSGAGRVGTAATSARPSSRSTPRRRWPRRCARSRPTRGRSSPISSTCRSARGALTGAWAHKSYMHIAAERLPMALADLHRARRARRRAPRAGHLGPPAARTTTTGFPAGTSRGGPPSGCATSSKARASTIDEFVDDGEEWIDIEATRARMLRRHRRPRACACSLVGLNPSLLLGRRRASASPGPAIGSGPRRSRPDS